MYEKRKRSLGKSVFGFILLAILVLLIVFVATFGYSVFQMKESMDRLVANAKAADIQGAVDEVYNLDEISEDVPWKIAEAIPYFGDDLTQIDELIDAGVVFCNDAVVPHEGEIADLVSGGFELSVDSMFGAAYLFTQVKDPLMEFADVIEAQEPYHLGFIEEKIQPVKNAVTQVDGLLEGLSEFGL